MNRDDAERLHTAVLVAPASEKRRVRKQRHEAAAKLQIKQQLSEREETRAKYLAELAERRGTTYLPAAGEPGPAQLRSPGRFRLPRHQAPSRARTRSSRRAGSDPTASSSARICTPVAPSSTTRGCCTPVASSPPRTSCSQASSGRASPAWQRASTHGLSRSGAASTCQVIRRANIRPLQKLSAGAQSCSGTD